MGRRLNAKPGQADLLRAASLLVVRLAACSLMSSFGGLSNRVAYSTSRPSLLRDAAAMILENNLVLLTFERGFGRFVFRFGGRWRCGRGSHRHRPTCTCSHAEGEGGGGGGTGRGRGRGHRPFLRDCRSFFFSRNLRCAVVPKFNRRLCSLLVPAAWVVASWGDYVFQSETRGVLPTVWVVAPGLKDPAVHAGAQLSSHRDVFVGGLARCLAGLAVAVAVMVCAEAATGAVPGPGPGPGTTTGAQSGLGPQISSVSVSVSACPHSHGHGLVNVNVPIDFRELSDLLSTPRVLGCNVISLLVLYASGAWAPLTNLLCCVLGAFVLTPPGGGSIHYKTKTARTVYGTARNGTAGNREQSPSPSLTRSRSRRPNVVLVVHESLSGAALSSARGRGAAPFYHGRMKSNADVYQFRSARALSGMTPIATPGMLTGLMPYTDEGVDLVRAASLAADFKAAGYETASFVSYGTDWAGSFWSVLTDLLVPGFDAVVDPKSTGDPLVNEYGMDDRVLVRHFERWLRTRGTGASEFKVNATNSNSTLEGTRRGGNETGPDHDLGGRPWEEINSVKDGDKPFFAVVVMNNNHFPCLWHESFYGVASRRRLRNAFSDTRANRGPWEFSMSAVKRYYSSIRTVDEALRALFDSLDERGVLDNTIVMGAGDHGDAPGKMKRLHDVDALILDIPLWMHVPRGLMPRRAYHQQQGRVDAGHGEKYDGRGRRGLFLHDNVDRGVSILDIVPTLRDILGMQQLFTPEEKDKCIVGMSLLSQHVPQDRVMVSWQGAPIHGDHAIGIFSTAADALVYYENDPLRSKIIEYTFGDQGPFSELPEHRLGDDDSQHELLKVWKDRLEEKGFLDNDLIKTKMPNLKAIFKKVASQEAKVPVMKQASGARRGQLTLTGRSSPTTPNSGTMPVPPP